MAIARRKAKKKVVRKAAKKKVTKKRVTKRRVVRKATKRRARKRTGLRRAASQSTIKVEVEENSMGDITITPVSSRVCRKYERHMKDVYGRPVCSAFMNDGFEAQQFLDQYPEIARRIESDRYAVVMMDPYEFGMLLGYDAEHVEI